MKWHALMIVSATILSATAAFGAVPEAQPESPNRQPPGWQPPPTAVGEWADRCTDFTVNSWGFKDPKNFVRLIELFSDPAIYLEFANRMQDPESYARSASSLLEPEAVKNYLEWSDPTIYTKWLQATLDPNFYTAALRPFLDMGTYMRWMILPSDPRVWSTGVNMANPAMWLKWLAAPLNPKVLEPLVKLTDVNNGARWLAALGEPTNFNVWGEWLPNLNFPSGGYAPFNPSNPPASKGSSLTPPPASPRAKTDVATRLDP
jgi:hypothetical protein